MIFSAKLQKQLGRNLNTTVWVNTSLMGLGLFNVLTPSTLAVFHNLTTTVIIGKVLLILNKKKTGHCPVFLLCKLNAFYFT